MMELFNLIPIHEAMRYGHWVLPTLDGLPRVKKPPLPVWIPGWLGVLFGTGSLWVLRLPSALLGTLTCMATYGLGVVASRDRRLGLFAAIALAGMFVFTRQARLASYDIYCTAFTTVGFMALLAMVEQPGRWWQWACAAGVALGLAVLSKGPVNPLFVCIPFGCWMLVYHRTRRAWLGLLLALLASIAVFLPWLLIVAQRYADAGYGNAWAAWTRQFVRYSAAKGPQYTDTRWYYFGMLGWVAPWTPALVAALALPFLPAQSKPLPTEQEKRTRWLFWLVLLLGLLLLTLPHQKKQRYALQQFPAAALLAAAVWQEFCRLRRSVKIEPAAGVLLAAQSLMMAGAGALLLAFIGMMLGAHLPPYALHPGKLSFWQAMAQLKPAYQALGLFGWLGIALALIAVGLLLWRTQWQRRFAASFMLYSLGTWLLVGSTTWAYRSEAYQTSVYKQPTRAMLALAGHHKIYTFIQDRPWLPVQYYANKILPPVYAPQLRAIVSRARGPVYVLTRKNPVFQRKLAAICRQTHRKSAAIFHLYDGHKQQYLYRLTAVKKQ